MKLQLEAHAKDTDMIEATCIVPHRTLLAFVVHIDCLDDLDIKQRLEDGETVNVELKEV